MLITRLLKVAMVASAALFALLVTFDNLVDYPTNYTFVSHTLRMDTTFPGNRLMGRAITSPLLWTIGYWLIIAAEAVTAGLLTLAAFQVARGVRGPAATFNAAKKFTVAGIGLGFLLWFTGFTVIGGEWFAMWQSREWNGLEPAFRFYITLLAILIFVNQPDD